jgi:hypothetical protein
MNCVGAMKSRITSVEVSFFKDEQQECKRNYQTYVPVQTMHVGGYGPGT